MLKIDQIEIIPLDTLPALRRVLPTGPIPYGENNLVGRSVLVAVRAGGITGWGQMRPVNPFQGETAYSMVAALRNFYAPLVVGRNALDRTAIFRDCWRRLPANPAALAPLDMALHDLAGRALGVPVHALLGGKCRDRIPLEWSVGQADADTMVAEAEQVMADYAPQYICFKVGPVERLDMDVDILHRVHDAVGDRARLALDANGALEARDAIRLARRLEDLDLAYFEQPVPQHSIDGMRDVRARTTVPVMADESIYSPADAARVLATGAADVACIKLYKAGGLWRGRQIATVAESMGYDVNSAGTANGSHLEALAAAHLNVSIPNHAFGAEFAMGLPQVAADEIAPEVVLEIINGEATAPDRPGLGADIDEAAVARLAIERILVKAP